jgi:hypothetical protein
MGQHVMSSSVTCGTGVQHLPVSSSVSMTVTVLL